MNSADIVAALRPQATFRTGSAAGPAFHPNPRGRPVPLSTSITPFRLLK